MIIIIVIIVIIIVIVIIIIVIITIIIIIVIMMMLMLLPTYTRKQKCMNINMQNSPVNQSASLRESRQATLWASYLIGALSNANAYFVVHCHRFLKKIYQSVLVRWVYGSDGLSYTELHAESQRSNGQTESFFLP